MTLSTKHRKPLALAAALFLSAAAASPASAQFFRNNSGKQDSKSADVVRDAFKSVVADANKSTVRVKAGDKEVALGTVVSADGYVLTKASELEGGEVTVALRDGTSKPAKIVGVAEDHDLALLKIDAKGLSPVRWADAKKAAVGQWVATAGMADAPAAIGVLSVQRRRIPGRNGLLGVMLADAPNGAKVMQVVPESPAEKAGIQVDDVIVKVNGKEIESREALVNTIRALSPGQEVSLSVDRGGKDKEVRAKLVGAIGPGGGRAEMMNTMGGPLSVRSANFPSVLQHDTVLAPTQVGGPLVTLDGRAVGINIARAGRVESYAIPSDVVATLIPDL
ncbi:MAG TPA: PDZ domain-containing protein, partial [Humisphaera sp.]